MSDYFEYIAKGDQNVYISLVNNEDCNKLFLSLDSQWSEHCHCINQFPGLSKNDLFILVNTLFFLAQRQIRNAYYLLLR
jgi:hypothetical protein